jgi:hypothetical protein
MNELTEICGADLQGTPVSELRDQCQNVGQAFGLSVAEAGLVVLFVLFGFFLLLAVRQRQSVNLAPAVGNAIEGGAYGAIGMYSGSSFGLVVAEITPPKFLGLILIAVGLVAVGLVICGVRNGDGDGKAPAMLLAILVGVVAIVTGAVGWLVDAGNGDGYETYLNVTAIVLGALGAIDALLAALLRGPHWAIGWALVALNSSWGFLGNVLGLANHIGSGLCYRNNGDPELYNRKAYSLYRRGLSLKVEGENRYAFTQGWVMACKSDAPLERHEALHVAQHFVLGPIYLISHGIWDAVGFVAGLFGAWAKKITAEAGITNMAYFNNPYEIMAYATHDGARDDTEPLVFSGAAKFVFMVAWILVAIAAFIVAVALWTS